MLLLPKTIDVLRNAKINIDQQHYLDFVVLAADVFCLTN